MRLVGADPVPRIEALDELPGVSNYLVGSDTTQWHTNVPGYASVRYSEVYPGIDLVFHGRNARLEYDFIVAPGADTGSITLSFQGADELELDSQGSLVLRVGGSEVIQHAPVIYQEFGGTRAAVAGGYVLTGDNEVGFRVGAYDATRLLVIDPTLVYSTYLGGSSSDDGYGIAADGSGNAYVSGRALSTNFPTADGFQLAYAGGFDDAFIAKIDTNASGAASLVYSTYLGGSGGDEAYGIAVDATGSAYVAGYTDSNDFPTEPAQAAPTGSAEAFVTKLNATGDAVVYSRCLGDNFNSTWAYAIALDASGNAYVAGFTSSGAGFGWPLVNGFQTNSLGNGGFLAKYNPSGSIVYSTFIGGSGGTAEEARAVAADDAGNAYVTGRTGSSDFQTTAGALQSTFGGGTSDAFLIKVDTTAVGAASLVYSTFLGGSGGGSDEIGRGIALDSSGNAYLAGGTGSDSFPITAGAFQPTVVGGGDAFVAKIDTSQSGAASLVYSTYLGSSAGDNAGGIDVDAAGFAYVMGTVGFAPDFPVTADAFQTTLGGFSDIYLAKIDTTASGSESLVSSTLLGGSASENGLEGDVAVDPDGNAYVTAHTFSTDFPMVGAYQASHAGRNGRLRRENPAHGDPGPAAGSDRG